MGGIFVNLSLTLSSAFLLLKDCQRNRLAGRLTQLKPTPTFDKYGKNAERDAVAAPVLQLIRLRAGVNSRGRNIFNGLLRVPVNEKIPALNRT
jgi:hypothetical protein